MNHISHKRKILILTSSYPAPTDDLRSSFGVFIKDFAIELSRFADVSVITQYNISHQSTDTIEDGIRVKRFSWAGKDADLADLHPIRDIFYIMSALFNGAKTVFQFSKEEKVDYIFSAWVIPGGFWALPARWFLKIPYGVWALGSDIWDYGKKPVIKNIITFILKNSHIQYADGIKLLKDMERLSGKKGYFLSTTRVLPNIKKKPHNIQSYKKNMLFIGRYHKNKGVDILLYSISQLKSKIRNSVHFHIFGGGPMENELREIVIANKLEEFVTINGWADEKTASAYLKYCDVLIIPSRVESIPVILSDALQIGCPIMVSNAGDMGDLISKYNAGMVIDELDTRGISRAISTFLSEDMKKYQNGAEKLGQLFDLKKNVKYFLNQTFNEKVNY